LTKVLFEGTIIVIK